MEIEKLSSNKFTLFATFIGIGVSLPALIIFLHIFVGENENWQHLVDTVLIRYISNTLWLIVGVALLTAIIGFVSAWITTLYKFPFSRTLEIGLVLPLAFPTYIIAFTYDGMFGYTGSITQGILKFLGLSLSDVYIPDILTLEGVIIVMSLVLYPYVYLISKASLLNQSAHALESARTLGAGSYRLFTKVGIPLAWPAIIAGSTLAVMEAISDYGAVNHYGVDTFTIGIFRTWNGLGDQASSAKLAAMLMVFVLIIIVVERGFRGKKKYNASGKHNRPVSKIELNGYKGTLAFFACFVPIFLGFLMPFVQMIVWSIRYFEDVVDEHFLSLMWNSFILAGVSSFIAIIFSLLITFNTRRKETKVNKTIQKIAMLGYSIPGAVIAVGVLIVIGWLDVQLIKTLGSFGFNTGLILGGTIIALVYGYVVRFMAISINSLESGYSKLPKSIDEAAATLGSDNFGILKRIHLNLLRPSIMAGALIVFVEVLKELPATLILRPFDFDTLAIYALELVGQEQLQESAIPALALVLIGLGPIILLMKTMTKSATK